MNARLSSIAWTALMLAGCGPTNQDVVREHAGLGERVLEKLAAIGASLEAASPPPCEHPPALRWSRKGPNNVDVLGYEELVAPAGSRVHSKFSYDSALAHTVAWMHPKSEYYLGKKDDRATAMVLDTIQAAQGLEYLITARQGAVDFQKGEQGISVYLVSWKDGAIVCGFRIVAGADPKTKTMQYDQVVVATGQVVNQHRVGFSDVLAASAGQNFQRAVREQFGIQLER